MVFRAFSKLAYSPDVFGLDFIPPIIHRFKRNAMTQIQRVRFVVCRFCGEQIVLPKQTLSGKSGNLLNWPMGTESITLVCSQCKHLFVYSRLDSHLQGIQIPVLNLPPTSFYRVEFVCAPESCGRQVVAYIRTESGKTQDEIWSAVINAKPMLTCERGHEIKSRANGVDVIEDEED